jgi:hypothetical protein
MCVVTRTTPHASAHGVVARLVALVEEAIKLAARARRRQASCAGRRERAATKLAALDTTSSAAGREGGRAPRAGRAGGRPRAVALCAPRTAAPGTPSCAGRHRAASSGRAPATNGARGTRGEGRHRAASRAPGHRANAGPGQGEPRAEARQAHRRGEERVARATEGPSRGVRAKGVRAGANYAPWLRARSRQALGRAKAAGRGSDEPGRRPRAAPNTEPGHHARAGRAPGHAPWARRAELQAAPRAQGGGRWGGGDGEGEAGRAHLGAGVERMDATAAVLGDESDGERRKKCRGQREMNRRRLRGLQVGPTCSGGGCQTASRTGRACAPRQRAGGWAAPSWAAAAPRQVGSSRRRPKTRRERGEGRSRPRMGGDGG